LDFYNLQNFLLLNFTWNKNCYIPNNKGINRKWLIFKNTNPLIGYDQRIVISKTGFIRAAGGCVVMSLDTEVGRRIVVLLGSRDTRTRIPEAGIIVDHAG
jgi:D-alanyl-D-alanine carboxypeptidase